MARDLARQPADRWLEQAPDTVQAGRELPHDVQRLFGELRATKERLNELLHPIFDAQALKDAQAIARGLPASPGAASGQIVFFADEAEEWVRQAHTVDLSHHDP